MLDEYSCCVEKDVRGRVNVSYAMSCWYVIGSIIHFDMSSTLVQTKHIDTTTTSKLMGNYR